MATATTNRAYGVKLDGEYMHELAATTQAAAIREATEYVRGGAWNDDEDEPRCTEVRADVYRLIDETYDECVAELHVEV